MTEPERKKQKIQQILSLLQGNDEEEVKVAEAEEAEEAEEWDDDFEDDRVDDISNEHTSAESNILKTKATKPIKPLNQHVTLNDILAKCFNEQLSDVMNKLEHVLAQNQWLGVENKALNKENVRLEYEMSEKSDQNKAVKEDNARLEYEITESSEQNKALKEENKRLEHEMTGKSEQIQQVKQLVVVAAEKIRGLQGLEEENSKLMKVQKRLDEIIELKSKDIFKIERRLQDETREKERNEVEIKELKDEYRAVCQEFSKRSNQILVTMKSQQNVINSIKKENVQHMDQKLKFDLERKGLQTIIKKNHEALKNLQLEKVMTSHQINGSSQIYSVHSVDSILNPSLVETIVNNKDAKRLQNRETQTDLLTLEDPALEHLFESFLHPSEMTKKNKVDTQVLNVPSTEEVMPEVFGPFSNPHEHIKDTETSHVDTDLIENYLGKTSRE